MHFLDVDRQILFSTSGKVHGVKDLKKNKNPFFRLCRQGQVGFCACCEIGNHIERALTGPGHVMRPMKILSSLRHIARDMSWGKQEDSHEFLRLLLDHIQKSCYKGITGLDNLSKETTIVNQIFGGFLRSQVYSFSHPCLVFFPQYFEKTAPLLNRSSFVGLNTVVLN